MKAEKIKNTLKESVEIVDILQIIDTLGLADSWLCAGSIRNFIWNGFVFDKETDVDVLFYDKQISCDETLQIEKQLRQKYPIYKWELKNQVYMHRHSPNTLPYSSARDAISKFPERCTAIGVRLVDKKDLELYSPYGLDDILEYRVRPTPHFEADGRRMAEYRSRIKKKNWQKKWNQLIVENGGS